MYVWLIHHLTTKVSKLVQCWKGESPKHSAGSDTKNSIQEWVGHWVRWLGKWYSVTLFNHVVAMMTTSMCTCFDRVHVISHIVTFTTCASVDTIYLWSLSGCTRTGISRCHKTMVCDSTLIEVTLLRWIKTWKLCPVVWTDFQLKQMV